MQKTSNHEHVLDFTRLLKRFPLKEPVRVVEGHTLFGMSLRLPRGADEQLPDHVLVLGGKRFDTVAGKFLD